VAWSFLHVLDPAFRQSRRAYHFAATISHFTESAVVVHVSTDLAHHFRYTLETPNKTPERNARWTLPFIRFGFWFHKVVGRAWFSFSL